MRITVASLSMFVPSIKTLALALLLMPTLASAAGTTSAAVNDDDLSLESPNQTSTLRGGYDEDATLERKGIELGYVYGYFQYSESGMKDTGNMQGMNFNYEKRDDTGTFLFRLESDATFGILQYDGALIELKSGNSTPHSTSTMDYILNVRALAGRPVELSPTSELVPYVGLGGRYLNDNMSGEGAYEREITYLYAPIGLRAKIGAGNGWSVTPVAEYDVFISGTVDSHVTQIGRGGDLNNHQSSGEGYRASIDIAGTINARYDLHFGPYYQHWHVNDSDLQMADSTFAGIEPDNTTDIVGFNFSVGL